MAVCYHKKAHLDGFTYDYWTDLKVGTYTIDFVVHYTNGTTKYLEVKGWNAKQRKHPTLTAESRRTIKIWKANNPELAESFRIVDEPDKIKRQAVRWRKENYERTQVVEANHRAKEKGIPGIITVEEWKALKGSVNSICPCCGAIAGLEVDHINPICKGGPNTIENLQPLCKPCNKSKFTKTIRYIN